MNKIYRIIWNSALNAYVVVSELTRNHTKRASATVATAVLATLLSATAQASTGASNFDSPSPNFDPENPTFTDDFGLQDENNNDTLKFGLLVVDKDGKLKDQELKNTSDEEQGKRAISVEVTESSTASPKLKSSYLYLREDGGIEINQEGRSAKFKVKHGDGLKIDATTDKLVADTVDLTVTNGKVSTPSTDDNKKLVNAGNLATELNKLGWQLKTTNGAAAAGTNATSTVKSGDEVEFKGEGGVTVTSSTTDGKHTVTIKAAQSANKGGAWKITADKEDGGELDPANTTPTEQEVKTGEKVTLKAGDNLKIKQNGKDFTYSLKKELKGLTGVETEKLSFGTNDNKVNITSDTKGLNFAKETAGANGDTTVHLNGIASTLTDTLSNTGVTTNLDGNGITDDEKKRAASVKDVLNAGWNIKGVKPGTTASDNVDFVRTYDTVEFLSADTKTTTVNVESKDNGRRTEVKIGAKTSVIAEKDGKLVTGNGDEGKGLVTAKTVIDAVNKSGWRVKTTDNAQTGQPGGNFETVTSGTNVTFADGNSTKANVTKDGSGNITVKYDVKTDGSLTVNNGDDKLKLNILDERDITNLLVLGDGGGVTVRKGEFNDVTTEAGQANGDNRGKVTVKNVADLANATEDDKKRVATVVDVAKAINEAATFVKVENDDTATIDDKPTDDGQNDALKAGDTLTFKAAKNLRVKRDGKSVTFDLAKDIEAKTATVSNKLSIGKDADKVDITSDTNGLKLSKGTNGDTAVHLNGLASTLPDVTTNTGSSTSVTFSPSELEKTRAATLKDVLNAGWNIKGAKVAGGNTENVDLVAGYDNVEFITGDKNTLDVVLTAKENGKTTEVKFTPKTSVIKEHNGKLFTGKDLKDANNGATVSEDDGKDTGTGLVTAKAVIDAVNKSGWRVSGEGTTAKNGATAVTADQAQTVTSGTSVNFKNGNATTATVSKVTENGETKINVKYDVTTGDGLKVDDKKITVNTGDGLKVEGGKVVASVGDGLKLDNQKIVADTTTLTVTDGKVTAPNGTKGDTKKLVDAGSLADALNKLSWKAKADKDTDGEAEGETDQEVKAGETVTFKAGKNLKVKQSGKDFTYSLKDELTGLTSITLGTAGNGKTTTKITENGLTVSTTPANGGTATEVKIGSDGISAGNKAITNVASGLKTYGDNQANVAGQAGNTDTVAAAKNGLIDLSQPNTGAAGTGTSVADTTAATVGDLRKLGWVLSADKTTNGTGTDTAFHAAVKNAEEVEFKGTGAATVSAKTENGKHTITVDVQKAEIETSDGIEKTDDGKLKLKVKTGDDNLLTVGTDGASVAKGKLEVVSTTTANGDKKGQVKAKSANGTDATDKDVATVKDVADAINKAETFVKVENSTEDIEDAAANGADNTEEALKAGDTLTFKAGKNLKVKRSGKEITFDLAKNLDVKTATVSDKLSIGKDTNKVNVTSTADGLTFAKENGTPVAGSGAPDTRIYLNGIATTLTEPSAGAKSSHVDLNVDAAKKSHAASIEDVLRAGWNIQGNGNNVDYVATYDTVNFTDDGQGTTTVTVTQKDNGKGAEVKIGAKTSVIKDHNGKLFTGKDLKDANNGATVSEDDGKDTGNGLVTAKAVIDAVNKSGWRIKTTAANGQAGQAGDNFETVTSGTNVTFDNGNGTTASVTKDTSGNGITVKYDVNVGDGLKVDTATKKIVADTTTLTVNGAAATGAVDNTTPKGKVKEITSENDKKKLVKAGDLVTALNSLSWTATAGAEDGGEKEGNATEQEVKAGDKVTFKAGGNLKIKQSGKDFTYSLKKDLKDLTSIELKGAANGGNNGASTKIDQNGLTITPAANGAGGTGAPNANTISVTKDGISVGGKTVKNVTSGLNAYGDTNNPNFNTTANSATDLERQLDTTGAYTGLLNLNEKGANKQPLVADSTAATVGDLRKLGWVLSSKNGTMNETSQQVKQADEVLFEGKGGAKVTSTSANGKHTITIDVAETKVGDGLEKDTDGKIKVKAKDGADNLLTVDANGASVAKGSFEAVKTDAPNAGTTADTNRGKVVVKASNGTDATDDDKKKVATVGDVADAINSAATFVKVESTEDEIEDNQPADNADQALKAGDTLTLKAGKNLKVKRDGKNVTFALAKDLDVKTAKVSDTLTIGGNIPTDGGAATPKVNITSTAGGLNFENAIADATGSKNVYLKGIATTLTEPSAGAKSSHVDLNVDAAKKSNAASIEDVLRAGWNIKGAKTVGGAVQNVDFVSTYDTVEFASGTNANVSVTTDDHKKTTVRVDVTGLPVQYVTEDGKTVVKVGNKYYEAKDDGSANMDKEVENGKLAKTKVKLVSASGKDPVKITNVAEGKDDNDAVSFKQLKALQDQKVTLTASNAYANGRTDADGGEAKQTLSNGLNFKFKSADGELLKISAAGDTVTFTPKEGSVQVGADGKATIQKGTETTTGLVEAGKLVDSLNKLGWKVGTGTDGTGAIDGTHTDTLVKSGDKVTLKAGDNLKVKQDGTNFTYTLKDELTGVKSVEFKDTANGANGASTKITKDGLTITPANGANGAAATDADKIKVASDGISAGNKAVKNVVSGLKKFGDGHTLANGTIADFEKHNDTAYNGLTNLDEKDANNNPTVADNTAATVGDLRGLGWVISADKTTGGSKEYHDQVRNANEVKFKSGNGINVSGKTLDNGTREITFELAKGEVVKSNEFTAPDGTSLVKVGDKYYSKDDIDAATGQPKTGTTEKYQTQNGKIVSTNGNTETTLTNKGSGYVTGNQVADAIAKSGFELGLADAAEAEKAFAESAKDKRLSKDKAETVNANDKVRFADGKHTKVSAATVESIDANGKKVTTTFVKTDVELPLTQIYNTDANGKKIVKNGDGKWYELNTDGTADTSKEVTLGNVDSDGKKVVKDNDKWYHAKADGTADTSTQAVDDSKVSTDEKHVVSLDPNNQSNGKGVVIDNVANGDISPTSKQAVNGSQIFALTGNKTPNITSITVDKDGKTVNVGTAGNANDTNKTYHNVVVGEDGKTPLLTTYNVEGRKEIITNSVVEAIYNMNEQGIKFFHSNDGKATSRIERSNEIDSSASGKFATAIGAKADAAGENAIAFGYGSKALRDNTVAIGTGNVVNAEKSGAFGDPNYIEDKAGGSYAFGNDNRITSKNTFVLGNSVNAKRDANGNVLTEEKEIIGKDGNKTTEKVPQALGKTVENSVYLGNASTATENPGSNLKSDGTAGNTTSAGATGTVNGFAGATAHGAVSVGASGEERRIQNVAAGEISATSTDAINGSQLYAATKGIADQAVGMVRALKRELEGVAAGANAAAALPQSYLPGKSMISAATGAYGSTGALAVGYSSISDNGKWVVKGQLNVNTRSKAGGGVGVGYIW
ncbi:Hia/Hsf adhesin N-terminal domain-containing protein [Neisseria lactamica]|uniref:Hia/Hsf adhesin N-terminal domain-containing protein n=1 Tax=Neisseria lactamica TaxID=486 RepID=UPI000E57019D|nr:Hia/Hsf adhesin N-terminal domain-containing protein [Neisseria lactamica]